MSIGDSAIQVAAMGPAATVFMGASAAANEAKSVLDQGGSNRQAFLAGAAETLFEKISIDNLLSQKSVTGWRSWLKETAKQAGVEANETEAAVVQPQGDFTELGQGESAVQAVATTQEGQTETASTGEAVNENGLIALTKRGQENLSSGGEN